RRTVGRRGGPRRGGPRGRALCSSGTDVRRVAVVAMLVLACTACSSKHSSAPKRVGEAGPPPGPTQHFHSRPDLRPPVIKILTPAHDTAPGYVFIAPKIAVVQAGPLIMDNKGQGVWFHPLKLTKGGTYFRVQRYRGKPVLTWWRGRVSNVGVGINGWYVIYDTSYRPHSPVPP